MLKPLMRCWISARMRRAEYNWQTATTVATISKASTRLRQLGVRLEKYKRLTVSAVLDSSVGGWDAGLAFDLIAVRVRFGDREIAPCPEQKWKPQASANRARLFASEPSYGWTVNMPLALALARSCRRVYGPGAGTMASSPIAAPEIYPSAYRTPTQPPDFAPIT